MFPGNFLRDNSYMSPESYNDFHKRNETMADRTIYCKSCNVYLGIIRDAKLRKGIVYLCGNCETKRLASDMMNKTKLPENDYMDIFKGMFNK